MHIGENIRKIRLAKDIKQEYICSKIGISQAQYSKLESSNDIRLLRLILICEILDMTIEEVINFKFYF